MIVKIDSYNFLGELCTRRLTDPPTPLVLWHLRLLPNKVMNMWEGHNKNWRDEISELTVSLSELFLPWISQEDRENLWGLCTKKERIAHVFPSSGDFRLQHIMSLHVLRYATKLVDVVIYLNLSTNIWMIIYLNWGERYEDMIDHRSYTHNLSMSSN